MNPKDRIMEVMAEGAALRVRIAEQLWNVIFSAAEEITDSFMCGGTLYIFGNGGSAADAQHLAAEFINRFIIDRGALPAIALTTDTSVITSIANDFSFDQIFSRQLEILAREGDVALGISTSGSSENVLRGLQEAKKHRMRTIALTRQGGKIASYAQISIQVPSDSTPRIQEAHITIGHIIVELAEKYFIDANTTRRIP